jgi:hypothetical protein
MEPMKVRKTLEEVKTCLRNLGGEFLESDPEIPGEAQVFEFSLILLRTVNEFTKNPVFGHF